MDNNDNGNVREYGMVFGNEIRLRPERLDSIVMHLYCFFPGVVILRLEAPHIPFGTSTYVYQKT